jgi:hypothetical protein
MTEFPNIISAKIISIDKPWNDQYFPDNSFGTESVTIEKDGVLYKIEADLSGSWINVTRLEEK